MNFFFFSSRRRHTRWPRDWSSDVCSSDLLSVERCGAQNPEHITAGDPELVRELAQIAGGALATMTVAPETEDAEAVIRALAEVGAVPSLGPTDSSSRVMTEALALANSQLRNEHGRSPRPTATHLFNGMRPIHHRDPGPALACR